MSGAAVGFPLMSLFASAFAVGLETAGAGSWIFSVDFVPSTHVTASGAQSSSSSSISAHLDSLPPSSLCKRFAKWIPYCCFNSSSVNCLGGGGRVANEACVSSAGHPAMDHCDTHVDFCSKLCSHRARQSKVWNKNQRGYRSDPLRDDQLS